MTMFGQSPMPIRRKGVTAEVRQAIGNACRSIYKDKPFNFQVVAYEYSTLLMYSVGAYSKSEIDPAAVDLVAMKSGFTGTMPEFEDTPTDIVLGSLSYPAPSSAKFMIIIRP